MSFLGIMAKFNPNVNTNVKDTHDFVFYKQTIEVVWFDHLEKSPWHCPVCFCGKIPGKPGVLVVDNKNFMGYRKLQIGYRSAFARFVGFYLIWIDMSQWQN